MASTSSSKGKMQNPPDPPQRRIACSGESIIAFGYLHFVPVVAVKEKNEAFFLTQT